MMLTRRLFSRRAPLAAAVLPSALHQTAGQGFGPPPATPPIYGGIASAGMDPVSPTTWELFRAARQAHDDARTTKDIQLSLLGGLDADLFALRSIPVQRKVAIQAERNVRRWREGETFVASLARKFGIPGYD